MERGRRREQVRQGRGARGEKSSPRVAAIEQPKAGRAIDGDIEVTQYEQGGSGGGRHPRAETWKVAVTAVGGLQLLKRSHDPLGSRQRSAEILIRSHREKRSVGGAMRRRGRRGVSAVMTTAFLETG